MNIDLVRKDTYYRLLGEESYKNYRILRGVEFPYKYLYYALDDGRVFIYDYILKNVLIPDKYEKSIENLIISSKIGFEHWKISKISDRNPYISNNYMRDDFCISDIYLNGEYLIENTKWNDKYKVFLNTLYGSVRICYEEKLNLIVNSSELNNINKLYDILLDEKGKDYKKSHY